MNHFKIKEIKKENQLVPLAVCFALPSLMGRFATPYYEDGERIRGILKLIGAEQQQAWQKIAADFRKNHHLADDEEVSESHPLFRAFNQVFAEAKTTLKQSDIAQFTQAQLQTAIDGRDWQFNDREIVEYWLIKV